MDLSNIYYDDMYEDEYSITLYFYGPASILDNFFPGKYPEAGEIDISIEFPIGQIEARCGSVMISPVSINEYGDKHSYDWNDVHITVEEIEILLDKARKEVII